MPPLASGALVVCAGSLGVPLWVSGELWVQVPVAVCSLLPTDCVTVPAVWTVFGTMGDPRIGIRASLMHFLSSLLPSARQEHHISSPRAFQPGYSVRVMCSPFPLHFPHFPALVFMVSHICFKSS